MKMRKSLTPTAVVVLLLMLLNAASGEEARGKACRPACPLIFAPICAWDGAGERKTFDNDCLLEVHNCQMRNAGKPTLNLVTNGPCL